MARFSCIDLLVPSLRNQRVKTLSEFGGRPEVAHREPSRKAGVETKREGSRQETGEVR